MKKIIVYFTGTFLNFFSLWIMSVLCVKILDYNAAGILSLGMSVGGIFVVISNYGMRSFQTSDIYYEYSDSVYFVSRILTSVIGLLLCFLFSLLMPYNTPQVMGINAFMLFKTVEALYDVIHGSMQRYGKTIFVGISLAVKGFINIITFSGGLLLTKNLNWALLFCTMTGIILFYLFDWRSFRGINTFVYDKGTLGEVCSLLRKCTIMLAFSLTSPVLIAVPRIFLERYYGNDLLGIYASIASPTIVISTFAQCILLPIIGETASAYQKKDKKAVLCLLLVPALAILFSGIVALLVGELFGSELLAVLYTDKVKPYCDILKYVILSVVLTSFIMCFNNFFIAIRELKKLLLISLTGCIIIFALSFFFVKKYNIYGISYVMIITQLIQLILMVFISFRIICKIK